MFATLLIFAVFVLVTTSAFVQNSTAIDGVFSVAPAVQQLDVSQYLGYWYQMYADAIVVATIEKDSFCDTATYGLQEDGKISVLNYAKLDKPTADGTDYTIGGYAYVPDATKPGELKVHFDAGSAAPPVDAPYWVLALGPVNSAGQYDWAIVSDNLSQFLFVLARDVDTFNSEYDSTVLETLKSLQFTGYKKPLKIYQGSDCVYNK